MKLSFETSSQSLNLVRDIRAEVVQSDENGSLLLVNGVPAVVSKRLQPGLSLVGTIEPGLAGNVTIDVAPGAVGIESALAKQLEALGMVLNEENTAILSMLRKYGIPLNADAFERMRFLLQNCSDIPRKDALEAVALLLSRNLPESALSLLKRFVTGKLNFSQLLSELENAQITALREKWNAGKIMQDLLETMKDPKNLLKTMQEEGTTNKLSDAFMLQHILSNSGSPDNEGRLYFQWPVFWQGADLPDNLEGEAYFSSGDASGERSFSLRLLVNPPALGKMEIGIHKLAESLWVNFSVSTPSAGIMKADLFPVLRQALLAGGWKSVRLSVGPSLDRAHFLAPPDNTDAAKPPDVGIDIRV